MTFYCLTYRYIVITLAFFALADTNIEDESAKPKTPTVQYETSHKSVVDDAFQTSHKITAHSVKDFAQDKADFGGLRFLRSTVNFLPTKERPELSPVLSALINEDVRKSIESKRAIEDEELEAVIADIDVAKAKAARQEKNNLKGPASDKQAGKTDQSTDMNMIILTTAAPIENAEMLDVIKGGFVEQVTSLDVASSENSKKSRIEIKKGPNGEEYEYEYVYYYEDDEEESKKTNQGDIVDTEQGASGMRGKSRYSSIDRGTSGLPTENSIISAKSKGRSSSSGNFAEDIEPERLPTNTRFPSRDKNIEIPPTSAIDLHQGVIEKKKISVKHPSLELVDSETFNTDEKQVKGSPRNGDTEANKPALAVQSEEITQPLSSSAAIKAEKEESVIDTKEVSDSTESMPTMQKDVFELELQMNTEKMKDDLTKIGDESTTPSLLLTTNPDGEESLTTFTESSTTELATTTTTTTTTTEAPEKMTTTKTTKPSIYGYKRPGGVSGGRHRFKAKSGGETSTASISETPVTPEQPKKSKSTC